MQLTVYIIALWLLIVPYALAQAQESQDVWLEEEQDALQQISSSLDSIPVDQPLETVELKSTQKKRSRLVSSLIKLFNKAEKDDKKLGVLEKWTRKLEPSLLKAWNKATTKESYRIFLNEKLQRLANDTRIQSQPRLAQALEDLQHSMQAPNQVAKVEKRSLMDAFRANRHVQNMHNFTQRHKTAIRIVSASVGISLLILAVVCLVPLGGLIVIGLSVAFLALAAAWK